MKTRLFAANRPSSWSAFAALIVLVAAACGVSDRNVTIETNGGTVSENGGTPSRGGDSGSSGRGGSPAAIAGASGSSGVGTVEPECDPECTGDTPICEEGTCVACRTGTAPRCGADETPERCEDGEWIAEDRCGGNRPVCSNGTCGAFRLDGGLVSATAASTDGTILLVDHGFEALPTLCAAVRGDTLCLTGGIRP